MTGARILLLGVGLLAGLSSAPAQGPFWRADAPHTAARTAKVSEPISANAVPAEWRDAVLRVMQQPTMTAVSPADNFAVNDELYRWMLDHPDRVSLAWRRLRVPAVEIVPLDAGRFTWNDGKGSELTWRTLARNDGGRIWYAEGKIKAGTLLPLVPVKAVAVLRHQVERDPNGRTMVRHQLEAFLQTESRFAVLVTRLLGPAGPKMAEDGADQLLYFFSGIARYLDSHPDKAPRLLAERR